MATVELRQSTPLAGLVTTASAASPVTGLRRFSIAVGAAATELAPRRNGNWFSRSAPVIAPGGPASVSAYRFAGTPATSDG